MSVTFAMGHMPGIIDDIDSCDCKARMTLEGRAHYNVVRAPVH